jgi:hypothetical protein
MPNMGPPPGGQTTTQQDPGSSAAPNPDVIAQMKQRADAIQNRAQGGSQKKFFNIPGPNGGEWKTAYVGYEGQRGFYFCGMYDSNYPNFVERTKRFWKSQQNPGGKSIYAGEDSLIATVMKYNYDNGNKPDFLKPNRQVCLQGFPLEYQNGMLYANANACMNQQGKIQPMLYNMSYKLFTKLKKEVQLVGAMSLQDPNLHGEEGEAKAWLTGWGLCFNEDNGRPFLVTKKKTGAEQMNVEFDISRLEPMPLPDAYRPGLSDMYRLHELFPEASQEEQLAAILEVGLLLPPGMEHLRPGTSMGPPQGGYPPMQQVQNYGQQPQQPQGYPPQFQQPAYPQQPYPAQPMIPPGMPNPQSYQQQPAPPNPNPYQGQNQGQPYPQQGQVPQPLPAYPGQQPQQQAAPPPPPQPPQQAQGQPPAPPPQPPGPPPQQPPPPPPQQAPGGQPQSPEQLQQQMQGTPFDSK